MEQAIGVFVNGIGGVFAGMAVLYLTIKLLSVVVGRLPEKDAEAE